TERWRIYIDARYQQGVRGDIEAAIGVYEQWAQVYPRDFVPRNNLGVLWSFLGHLEKAAAYYEEAHRVDPSPTLPLSNLAFVNLGLGRSAEAVSYANRAIAATGTNSTARNTLLAIACANRDDAEVSRVIAEARRHNEESVLHGAYACFSGHGRLKEARAPEAELLSSKPHITISHHIEHVMQVVGAEWWLGDRVKARTLVVNADGLLKDTEQQWFVPPIVALAGEDERARRMTAALLKDTPESTLVNGITAPLVGGLAGWHAHRPDAALAALREGQRYAQALPEWHLYVGLAHQQAGSNAEAIASFREGLTHSQRWPPSSDWAQPVLRVLLARALSASGDVAGARQAYEAFFKDWEKADADAPLLVSAKREYAALK